MSSTVNARRGKPSAARVNAMFIGAVDLASTAYYTQCGAGDTSAEATDPHLQAKAFMNFRSLPLLIAIGLALAGCLQSEQPKFSLADVAAPLGEGGRYAVFERGPDNRYQRQEAVVIKRRADGAYDFVDEKGETQTVSLHPLGPGLFVAQAKAEKDDDPGYGYAFLRVSGSEALVYVPQCDAQDKAMLAAAGVEVNAQMECILDRVADAPALFKRLALGEPVSKLVRE
jgi:hypothetical protein